MGVSTRLINLVREALPTRPESLLYFVVIHTVRLARHKKQALVKEQVALKYLGCAGTCL
ncbi:MAG TPA: hypothetical protein VGI45_18995 [Terracidiphilus sp.]